MANLVGPRLSLSLLERQPHRRIPSRRRISQKKTKGSEVEASVNPRVPPPVFHLHIKPVKILLVLQRPGHSLFNHPILLQDQEQVSRLAEHLTVLLALSLQGRSQHRIARRRSTLPLHRSRLGHLRLQIYLPSGLSQLHLQLAPATSLRYLPLVSGLVVFPAPALVGHRILLGLHPPPRRYRQVVERCSPLVPHRLPHLVV